MAEIVDLEPAAQHLSALVRSIREDQLGRSTPCGGRTVADILDHVDRMAQAFTAAAAKDFGPATSSPSTYDGSRLDDEWQVSIPDHVDALARAWAHPAAWEAMTQVGGMTLPSEQAGHIALSEIVIHTWDLAKGAGLPYRQDQTALEKCLDVLHAMYPADELARREGVFAPPVDVPPDAPLVDRVMAFSGRDPYWSAPT